MAINFPDSPTNGQVATIGGKNYTYNSTKNTWTPTQVTEADLSSVGSTTVVATHDLLPSSPSAGDMALVSSVNKMYVYFLSGWWLMSSLQNASPSGITGNAAIYDLAADGTPTTVTLSSSDPEGFPISWSHSVISGSLGGTTVTNVDNVFTITPSTDAADAGTFTLRFAATDGQGGESGSQSNFTLDFVFIVANSRYTTLLATAVDTSDNNNITDASTNNHSITVNGDAYAGTFSPYRSGAYSGLFDSTSVVQLSFAGSSDFEFGTGNFTIEMWFKWNSSNKPDTTIFSNRISGSTFSTGRYFLKLMPGDATTGGIEFAFDCGAPRYRLNCVSNLTANDAFFDEGWHHYAAVRNGTSLKLFVDGQEVDEITLPANETNFGNSSDNIGLGINNGVSSPIGPDGEYRDVRIVKGVAIIPPSGGPTEPLEAVSGTTFLLYNGEGYVKDKASNHSPIYGSTVPTITATGPFDYNEYSATDHGGSVYHEGTAGYTDYLEANYTAIGTNDFTLQFWVYPETSSDPYAGYFSSKKSTSIPGITVAKDTIDIGTNTSSFALFGNPSIKEESWSHIAVVRSGDVSTAYVNGKSLGSVSGTGSSNISSDVFRTMQRYGYNQGGGWPGKGYISDLKMSQTVDYSSNFTPPTAPLSSSGAEFHIKGIDASIIDKSQGANLKLVGNTTGSTTTNFTGAKSMYFDGSGDYLSTLSSDLLRMGTGNFTVECWVNKSLTNHKGIWQISSTAGGLQSTNYGQTLALGFQIGLWQIYAGGGSGGINGPSFSVSANTWYHTAVVRNSGTTKLYIDGTEEISISDSHDYTGTYMVIGGYYNTSYLHHGYIQDLRVTKGLARYTANFTPPTTSLEG